MGDVTQVLAELAASLPGSTDALAELVYTELRQLAGHKLAMQPPGQTLQPTALVHEAWLRLFGGAQPSFATRAQFFAAAAQGMRHILIDRARRKQSLKRGSGVVPLSLDDVDVAAHADDDTLLLVNEALERLQTEHPEAARFVELRFFAGLNNAEAAQALGLAERTARRHWTFARAWLYQEIRRLEGEPAAPANRPAARSAAGELARAR